MSPVTSLAASLRQLYSLSVDDSEILLSSFDARVMGHPAYITMYDPQDFAVIGLKWSVSFQLPAKSASA
jgi:hypothetical protein